MYDKDTSQPAGSWGKFAGRMYFPDNRTYDDTSDIRSDSRNPLWTYIAISALYLFLIAVVLTVLLLAPKYRITSSTVATDPFLPVPTPTESGSDTAIVNINDETIQQYFQGNAKRKPVLSNNGFSPNRGGGNTRDESIKDYAVIDDSKEDEVFLASIKDPLYDIDPRSQSAPAIFRGDEKKWEEPEDFPDDSQQQKQS